MDWRMAMKNGKKRITEKIEKRRSSRNCSGRKKKRNNGKIYGFIGVLIILTVSLAVWFSATDNIQALRSLGYIGAFMISVLGSATVILPIPSWTAIVAMGTRLDPLALGIIAGLGNTIGESTGYLAGLSGRIIIKGQRSNGLFHAHNHLLNLYGPLAIFFFAFLPNPLFDIAGITAGAVRMPFWQFIITCFMGKTLRFILFAYAGFYFLADN